MSGVESGVIGARDRVLEILLRQQPVHDSELFFSFGEIPADQLLGALIQEKCLLSKHS